MPDHNLYVNYQLNFDEAIRQIKYWASVSDDLKSSGPIRLLAKTLQVNKNNLFFEEKT